MYGGAGMQGMGATLMKRLCIVAFALAQGSLRCLRMLRGACGNAVARSGPATRQVSADCGA